MDNNLLTAKIRGALAAGLLQAGVSAQLLSQVRGFNCDGTLRFTRAILTTAHADVEAVITALGRDGITCDCRALMYMAGVRAPIIMHTTPQPTAKPPEPVEVVSLSPEERAELTANEKARLQASRLRRLIQRKNLNPDDAKL